MSFKVEKAVHASRWIGFFSLDQLFLCPENEHEGRFHILCPITFQRRAFDSLPIWAYFCAFVLRAFLYVLIFPFL